MDRTLLRQPVSATRLRFWPRSDRYITCYHELIDYRGRDADQPMSYRLKESLMLERMVHNVINVLHNGEAKAVD